MSRTLTSILVMSSILFLVVQLTNAFFSDTESSVDNTLAAGSIDLKIDNTSYYNGVFNQDTSWSIADLDQTKLFFNFQDLKPGDWGEDTISIHVDNNDAWACMDINLTSNDDNSCTEAELEDDPDCEPDNNDLFDGDLGGQVNMIFWVDDGDNVLEDNENIRFLNGTALDILSAGSITLADSQTQLFPADTLNSEGALIGLDTYYIGKAWCFGDLTMVPEQQDGLGAESTRTPNNSTGGILCSGSGLNNASQTDSILADISFRAEQYRNNPDFVCDCSQEVFGFEIIENLQGTRKDNNPITGSRTDENNALGEPDWTPGSSTNFFSLGKGGSITIAFESPVSDKTGDDLTFYEATNGRNTYPLESAEVLVSADNSTYYSLGNITSEPGADGVVSLDISSNSEAPSSIKYVKLIDNTDYGPHLADADGYDFDAISAAFGQCEE